MTREYYRVLMAPLRHVAERYGYALTVHGSLGMDIDLVAVPWRESCAPAADLADALRRTAEIIIGRAETRPGDPNPMRKPCGRLAWAFYLGPWSGDVPYIDLSVIAQDAALLAQEGGGK